MGYHSNKICLQTKQLASNCVLVFLVCIKRVDTESKKNVFAQVQTRKSHLGEKCFL